MIIIILNLCRETLSDGQTEGAGVDADTREWLLVVGEGDDIGRCRLPFKRIFVRIFLALRDFAKGYLIEFVMEHSGKHL